MEPETKLEAMTYLVSFTHYSLTHSLTTSAYPFPPFQFPIFVHQSLTYIFNIHLHTYLLTHLLTSSTFSTSIKNPAPSSKPQTTTHSQQQRLFGRCRQHLSQHQI